jgi:hypothetical protein
MGLISISGEPGSAYEEIARLVHGQLKAQGLDIEFVTSARLDELRQAEIGESRLPPKLHWLVSALAVARIAARSHVVVAAPGAEKLSRFFTGILRCGVFSPRPGKTALRKREFDILLNAGSMHPEQAAAIIERAAAGLGLFADDPAAAFAAQLAFRLRLQLARHGIAQPESPRPGSKAFGHPSEQVFASLLDFYRIDWEYEPRNFPLEWDPNGKVLKAMTPDFYLPEFNLYVELTTMKQSLVTKKNQKLRLLRQLYPDVQVQIFYQKDFENLVFKYGLQESGPRA